MNVYLLPFVKPAHVRRFFPETEIASWTDAVAAAVGEMHPDPAARSVLAAHLMAAGSQRCESEEIYVGDAEAVTRPCSPRSTTWRSATCTARRR